jgi:hypothetical protein
MMKIWEHMKGQMIDYFFCKNEMKILAAVLPWNGPLPTTQNNCCSLAAARLLVESRLSKQYN